MASLKNNTEDTGLSQNRGCYFYRSLDNTYKYTCNPDGDYKGINNPTSSCLCPPEERSTFDIAFAQGKQWPKAKPTKTLGWDRGSCS